MMKFEIFKFIDGEIVPENFCALRLFMQLESVVHSAMQWTHSKVMENVPYPTKL